MNPDALNRIFWGAHAPRVLAMAPSPSQTCSALPDAEDRFGEAPKPAREARALPGEEDSRH